MRHNPELPLNHPDCQGCHPPMFLVQDGRITPLWTHKRISYLKSVVRLLGYALLAGPLTVAVIVLVASEVLGIVEEWGNRG